MLGLVAGLNLIVGLAFPVSVELRFRSSAAAWARAVGFRVLLSDPSVSPSRGGGATEYRSMHFVPAVLGKRSEVTDDRAKVSACLETFSVSEFGSAFP